MEDALDLSSALEAAADDAAPVPATFTVSGSGSGHAGWDGRHVLGFEDLRI